MRTDELQLEGRQSRAPTAVSRPVSVSHRGSRRIAWLYVALWIVMIQTLGGDSFSSSETSRLLGPLLHGLFPEAGTELLGQIQFAIRKAAHFVEYGVLALLCIRAWRLSYAGSESKLALASVAVVVAVAAVDELRQAQATDRTGAMSDVVLDTFGAVSALVGGRFATRWLSRWR